ncbi:CBASS cGAMP-activated phospholipase [Pseudodesulfovibrio pelocollis]|uniref:CBASS cGAMP-activated phospholipase n=1 Tax=Pseudodesulfovibrio pelocollis TaxID=3051432 RepID=UPI00255B381A|nr:CBASS cGAMP-activated phospholipase [Pseudodesulfovibrio sp. SB368]
MRKILSIDGGGIKGVFPAAYLAEIEEKLGEPIVDYFDLIAGTSTGGIIALGLGLGFSPREILALYEDNADKIFPPIPRKRFFGSAREYYRCAFEAKYSTKPLQSILRRKFQGRLLGQSSKRLMICATNLMTGRVNVFKTSHHERLETDYLIPAEEIALATSAAPFLFNPHKMPNGISLVDGALWGNNPVGYAAIEAVNYLGWAKEDVVILSLSCTSEAPEYAKLAGKDIGGLDWGLSVAELAMDSQSSASLGIATHVLGDPKMERIKRIDLTVPSKMFTLTGTDRLEQLSALGRDKAKYDKKNLEEMFFSQKAEPFVPFRKL